MADDEYLTPEEAAALFRVSLKTIQRKLQAGVIPASRVGRLWRIRRSDLEAAFAAAGNPRPHQQAAPPTRGSGPSSRRRPPAKGRRS